MENTKLKNELLFEWVDNAEFKNKLTRLLIEAKSRRKKNETQKQISEILEIPLTKIKQIENGTSKDINAIVDYLAFQGLKI